jgi:hypothetical protein
VVPWEDPVIGPRPSTKLLLSTGDRLEVAGTVEDVEKPLQNASRSSPGTLAWLKDADTGEAVCVNPAHVVLLSPAPDEPVA